ncbi:uncharacterized protein LOC119686357 [Teleopsis dalmanni]|uniref:uncharacterized protein LOC119686357 n=1 Tax=Teleopsis dalmanni TaxID=139649 RepID=UPI0018CD1344|nr:uncharacterized protein LOC119686357 [Teleopsis dalmanni]
MSLLLLPIVLCLPVNVTELRSAPGINFEQVGTTKLITSHWKVIIYYDLAPFNTELDILKDSTLNLLKLCDQSNLNSTCKFVVQHFQQAEIELRTAFEFMSSARNKRGAIDFVGNIASSLFGVLDSNYASDMSKTIKNLEENDKKLKHLLKNQISIIDSTINVIKQNQISLKNNFQDIENQLNTISKRLVKDEHDQLYGKIINMLTIQMTTATINLQRAQSTIMYVLIDSHHEKINPLLITPQQLITEGEKIRAHLPSHLQFPVEQNDILTLYKLMQVTGQVSSDHVIFNIMIPLVERKNFEIFHVVPTKVLTSIKPSTEYLAINSHKDKYFPITKLALQSCITTEED